MTDVQRLIQLLAANHPCISMVTTEESHALQVVKDAAMGRPQPLWSWSMCSGVRSLVFEHSEVLPDTEHPAAALYHFSNRTNGPAICVMLDLAEHLADARTLRLLRETIDVFREHESHLILIDHRPLPPVVSAHATAMELSLPCAEDLEGIVRATLKQLAHRGAPLDIRITKRDLRTILRNLSGLTRREARQIIMDVAAEDRRLDARDINSILAKKRQLLHVDGLLEYIEAPVSEREIGGMSRLKRWLRHRQHALADEAAAFGIAPPRGVLMLGVQGAGKSLCAKAVATAWQRPLLRLDPGRLYDRFIGESEQRLRDALRQAEMMAPIILWIDEIEKGFASAASHNTDGGLSQRMFGTFLTWLQEHAAPVFVVATANDIEALPPELLRKGRFDEIFFVDLPDHAARKQIFEIHLARRKRDPARFDLPALAAESDGYSGAEIEAAVSAALHDAFAEGCDLSTAVILDALRSSPPLSITMAERVQALRDWAQGRCVPAD